MAKRQSPKSRSVERDSSNPTLGTAIKGLIQQQKDADEEFQNASAKIRGRRAYYQGSPSSDEVKQKVRKKMGSN